MPWKKNIVLIAKNAYVWLAQLSKQYQQKITHLDQIPQEELEKLSRRGISALWLIGIWERSPASKKIKELYGRKDIAASAYSLKGYSIAQDLGGEEAADVLTRACLAIGIRLCVDMVPNHTGLDSDWLLEHPEWYIAVPENPNPSFHFNSPDLSPTSQISIRLEEGYYDQTATAEVFLFEDHRSGEKRYIYHGNDGSSMPWNDTAQLNYLDGQVREQVIKTILEIAKRFPLIRFDAAMTLSRQHFQRLWYPLPNSSERCIPTREKNVMMEPEFQKRMPQEFWQEVVERVEQRSPETVLMAEAFWYMENYFIEDLGMHQVYNIAFMQSLRDEDNITYQSILKNALKSDPQKLGKFINFLSNPDERTTIDQFGRGDKYFAACTILATMPGIPMFSHGQLEGFSERYGMDFLAPRLDEQEDEELLQLHEKWIFPLLQYRACFSDASFFRLFEVQDEAGSALPQVYAYLNQTEDHHFLTVVNNSPLPLHARFHQTVPMVMKKGKAVIQTVHTLLPIPAQQNIFLRCREIRTDKQWQFSTVDLDREGFSFSLQPYQHLVCELSWSVGQEGNVSSFH